MFAIPSRLSQLSRVRPHLLHRSLTTLPPPPSVTLNHESLSSFIATVQSPISISPLATANDPTYARLDPGRAVRTGFPEVIFGTGKTPLQVSEILTSLSTSRDAANESHTILATRVSQDTFDQLPAPDPTWQYCPVGHCISVPPPTPLPPPYKKTVLIITAGTTDIPVAAETALTLAACNIPAERLYDCGVAGLHRIVSNLPLLTSPDIACIIVAAGMDGALPSVVSGLVSVPVIAVPTAVGYGYGAGGMAALGTMLNSCSPGVVVVNVDNGFGAAAAAFKICKLAGEVESGK